MIGQKRYDFEAMQEVWRLIRDFNDIAVGEDDRWRDFLDKADEVDRRFPEYAGIVAYAIKILEDRSNERFLKSEAAS